MNKGFIVPKSITYAILCALLIAGFGCKKDEEKGPKPIADFSSDITTVYECEYVDFYDLSQNSPNRYEWHFYGGDPEFRNFSGTGSDFIVIDDLFVRYDSIGTFPVSLTVRNKNGESTIVKQDYIKVISNPNPIIHCKIIGNGIPESVIITYLNENESVDCIVNYNSLFINKFYAVLPIKYLDKTVSLKCVYTTDGTDTKETQSINVNITQNTYLNFNF